jgi:hypothetical protein
MKKGDLVCVHPAKQGLYLIVEEATENMFILYGEQNDTWDTLPMQKRWIEVISESK